MLCTVIAQHKAAASLPSDARQLGMASIVVSVAGIVVFIIILLIFVLLLPLGIISVYGSRVQHPASPAIPATIN